MSSIAQEGSLPLFDVLKAQTESVDTFAAQVRFTDMVGKDVAGFSAAQLELARWIRKHEPNLPAENLEKSALAPDMPSLPPRFFRYYAQRPGKIRIEDYGEGENAYAREPNLQVFVGDRWQHFTPKSRLRPGEQTTRMSIIPGDWGGLPGFETARGQALPTAILQVGAKLSERAKAMGQVSWSEFFLVASKDRTVARDAVPGGNKPKPRLELMLPPHAKVGRSLYRVRIWFDPDNGYAPLRLECSNLEPAGGKDNWTYLPDLVAEWSDPVRLSNGTMFPRACVLRTYRPFRQPVEGVMDSEEWPAQNYELRVHRFQFSDIRVNEPLDASLFKIVPPTGTHVVDEVSGHHYFVGSTGEQLKKEALAHRAAAMAQTDAAGQTSWWRPALVYGGLALVAVLAALYIRRRYFLRSAS